MQHPSGGDILFCVVKIPKNAPDDGQFGYRMYGHFTRRGPSIKGWVDLDSMDLPGEAYEVVAIGVIDNFKRYTQEDMQGRDRIVNGDAIIYTWY